MLRPPRKWPERWLAETERTLPRDAEEAGGALGRDGSRAVGTVGLAGDADQQTDGD